MLDVEPDVENLWNATANCGGDRREPACRATCTTVPIWTAASASQELRRSTNGQAHAYERGYVYMYMYVLEPRLLAGMATFPCRPSNRARIG